MIVRASNWFLWLRVAYFLYEFHFKIVMGLSPYIWCKGELGGIEVRRPGSEFSLLQVASCQQRWCHLGPMRNADSRACPEAESGPALEQVPKRTACP